MKISAIWALLKKRKTILIQREADTIWVGDGVAAYPIYTIPTLNKSIMQTLLDVGDDAWSSFTVSEQDSVSFNTEDNEVGERELRVIGLLLSWRGVSLIPLTDGNELYYIRAQYLNPFNDFAPLFYFRRTGSLGGGYIVAKEGMLIRGVIMPYEFLTADEENYLEALHTTYERTKYMMQEHEKVEQAIAELAQLSLDDEEEEDDS
jgi:hypothetical protein